MIDAIESDDIPRGKHLIFENAFDLPTVSINRNDLAAFQERLETSFPIISGKKIVLIYPGGGALPIRAWPLDHFVNLVKRLVQNKYFVGIIGLSQDKLLANQIIFKCQNPNVIDLTGYTHSLKELLLLFHLASLLITNDGGPGHLAGLTALSAIILYGPETPLLYSPLSSNSENLYKGISCSPCLTAYNHRNSPCDGNNLCLKLISPEDVFTKVKKILDAQHQNNP